MRLGVDASMLTPRRAGVGNYVFNLLVEMTAMPIPPEIVLYSARTIAHDCKQFARGDQL